MEKLIFKKNNNNNNNKNITNLIRSNQQNYLSRENKRKLMSQRDKFKTKCVKTKNTWTHFTNPKNK